MTNAQNQKTNIEQNNMKARMLEAVAEIVHQGFARILDVSEVVACFDDWKPTCFLNYEYIFARHSDFDMEAIDIDWERPDRSIVKKIVSRSFRIKKILNGSPMTMKEMAAYRLEVARREHGYQTAEERLESGTECKWADLSGITAASGREILVLELGDPVEEDDSIDWPDKAWRWKERGIELAGLFSSGEEAERWMAENGAFEEI
jgi:hypothetical protein